MTHQEPSGPSKNPEMRAFEGLAARWLVDQSDTTAEISIGEEPSIDTDWQTASLAISDKSRIAAVITHPGDAPVASPLPEGGDV